MEIMNGKNLNEICHVCIENAEELSEFKPLWYEIYHSFIGVFQDNCNNLPCNICKKCKSYFESIMSLANKCKTNEIRLADLGIKKNRQQICGICLGQDRILNECPPNLYELYKNFTIKKSNNDVLNLCEECKSYLQLIMSVINKWKLNKLILERYLYYDNPELALVESDLVIKEEIIEIEYNDLMKEEIAEACMTLEKILNAQDENNSNFQNNNSEMEWDFKNQQALVQSQNVQNPCAEDKSNSLEDYEQIHLQNQQMLMPKEFNIKNIDVEKDDNEVKQNSVMKESEKPENKNNSRKSQKKSYSEKPENKYNSRKSKKKSDLGKPENKYNLRKPGNQEPFTSVTVCEHCQKPLSSKRGFTKHVACIIREETKFECFTCGKFLASKSSLINHDKRLHKRSKRD